jgi:hypothetical protein
MFHCCRPPTVLTSQDEGEVCRRLAAEIYCAELGARSIEAEVERRVIHMVSGAWFEEQLVAGGSFAIKPDPLADEGIVLDLSVSRSAW